MAIQLDDDEFEKCRWFSRGWTLQELLAPRHVKFYDKEWQYIGDRRELCKRLAAITGIAEDVLLTPRSLYSYSIAQRMSWASKRVTTRSEDVAYCLMGIFNINMPLLYGEGQKAFTRLQEEIIKLSDDQSIFAWTCNGSTDNLLPKLSGALAESPASFRDGSEITIIRRCGPTKAYSMTNKGLRVKLPLARLNGGVPELSTYRAVLDCGRKGKPLAITVTAFSPGDDQYARVISPATQLCEVFENTPSNFEDKKIFIRTPISYFGAALTKPSTPTVLFGFWNSKTYFPFELEASSSRDYGIWRAKAFEFCAPGFPNVTLFASLNRLTGERGCLLVSMNDSLEQLEENTIQCVLGRLNVGKSELSIVNLERIQESGQPWKVQPPGSVCIRLLAKMGESVGLRRHQILVKLTTNSRLVPNL